MVTGLLMNIGKFPQKSIRAVNDLEKIAYQFGNEEIEQGHLLYRDGGTVKADILGQITAFRPLIITRSMNILSVIQDTPFCGAQHISQYPDHGSLSCSVGAKKAVAPCPHGV